MSRTTLIGLLVAGMAYALSLGTARADGAAGGNVLKVVVHVNFPETGRQGAGLKNVANLLKQAPDAQIEVVGHGAGISLVEKARTEHPQAVAALLSKGVKFVACENTMRQKSIRKEDLLPGVATVPSGTVEVIRKQQQDGYAYFKP